MPVEQNTSHEIGVVTGISGDAYAESASGMRALEPGSPIYQGEELVTGDGSNVEVRFVDDTLISQGSNSRIALDDYVYDPDGGESSFLADIAEGTFRTVTGKIAEQNPDRFKLGSPLATIGIRGTIILSEVTDDGEKHGVEEIHAGKAMLLQSKATGEMRQLLSGQMVDVGRSGLLSPVRSLAPQERDQFRKIAPENIRQEQELREQQREEEEEQQEEQGQEGQQEEQQDEPQGEQQGDPKEELPGDVDPGGGTPGEDPGANGGALHPGKGVIDPGDDALVGQQRFEPDKMGMPPKPDEKPEVEGEKEQQGQQQEEGQQEGPDDPEGGEQEDNEKPKPVVEPDAEENDDTDEKEDDDDESDDSGGSSSNPHVKTGSGLLEGTDDADTLTGSSSADTLKGYGGNDTLYGEGGNDQLFGGDGNDKLYGGEGADTLSGGTGDNTLDGGEGLDVASFAGFEEALTLTLNSNDTAYLNTDSGQHVLINIEGVIGGSGQDIFTGDDEANIFETGMNSNHTDDSISSYEQVDGMGGSDWIQFETLSSEYHVEINLDPISGSAGVLDSDDLHKNDIGLKNVENAKGSSGNDKITGSNSVDNTLMGEAGDDTLEGLTGNDHLYGGSGNDRLDGGDGDDHLYGGAGNDFINAGKGTNVIEGGTGIDSLTYKDSETSVTFNMSGSGAGSASSADTYISDTFSEIENIEGSNHDDTFNGSAYADTFDGNDGADTMYGNGGDDHLSGGDGHDEISGGAGDDTIMGGAGNNILHGGSEGGSSGSDTVSYADHQWVNIVVSDTTSHHIGDTTFTDGLTGFSTYIGSDGNDTFMGDTNGNTFVGGKGNDSFIGDGGNNYFIGGAGIDTISFANSGTPVTVTVQTGDTTVTHSDGEDVFNSVESFIGTSGDDIFNGSNTSETFRGGDGADTIDGGNGSGIDYASYSDSSAGISIILNGCSAATTNTSDTLKNIEGIIGSGHQDDLEGDDNDNYFAPGLNAEYVDDADYSDAESVNGGDGSDWLQFDNLESGYYVIADLTANHAYVKSGSSNVNKIMLTDIENVIGSAGNDNITALTSESSTIQGGGGSDTINLGVNDGKATTLVYTSLAEGGDTINKFQTTDPTAANNDKLYFKGSDFDSAAGSHLFNISTASATYDEATSGLESGGCSYTDACFVFDTESKGLYYDANGSEAGGQTLIATFDANPNLEVSDIDVA
ncbi:hypothetical protein D0S45_14065 [Marinifilum sp. JC120]|nr:hypothetical protein D0S45_14065 [Marinifilum sp. JC120]